MFLTVHSWAGRTGSGRPEEECFPVCALRLWDDGTEPESSAEIFHHCKSSPNCHEKHLKLIHVTRFGFSSRLECYWWWISQSMFSTLHLFETRAIIFLPNLCPIVVMSIARKQPMGMHALTALNTGCMVGESVISGTLGALDEGSGHQASWGLLSLAWSFSLRTRSQAHWLKEDSGVWPSRTTLARYDTCRKLSCSKYELVTVQMFATRKKFILWGKL